MTSRKNLRWPNKKPTQFSRHRYVNGYMVACNYHPRANASAETMFIQGEPCSKCSRCRNECSHRYNGLCGIGLAYIEWWASFAVMRICVYFSRYSIKQKRKGIFESASGLCFTGEHLYFQHFTISLTLNLWLHFPLELIKRLDDALWVDNENLKRYFHFCI